ncbi:ATP-binding protein [Actinomadura geliboluensis]|uniref:ATP-binding protein n=1 Tax=Actinomadura geliboluensis TaxID=882440 RepID=UPI00197AFC62|nr:ATP-binding protein [Actinomadura geliboluensis]
MLLLVAGSGLIASVYFVMRQSLADSLPVAITKVVPPDGSGWGQQTPAIPLRPGDRTQADAISLAAAAAAKDTTYHHLLIVSLISLAIFAAVSVFLAWWMAGRVLRPVHTITATARRLSGENLNDRIALKAPPGELKDLADTFDDMLDRLQRLVNAQQRFVANSAHELRTPLAVQRAALEIGLADPVPGNVARVREKLLNVADRSERLIEGLLLLSTSDQGLDRPEPIDAYEVVAAIVAEHTTMADDRDVSIKTHLATVQLDGDPTLFKHLVRNLMENALRYNLPGGTVRIRLDDRALEVYNTGPVVPVDVVPHLFEPFRRMHPRRHARGEGTGLGLSIVASIAHAHAGEITAQANPSGGLNIRISFPSLRSVAETKETGDKAADK